MRGLRPTHWWIAAVSLAIGIAIGWRTSSSDRTPASEIRASPASSAPTAQPTDRAAAPRDQPERTTPVGDPAHSSESGPGVLPLEEGAVVASLRERRLTLPVAGITAGDLRPSFHERRDGTREHEALDILAPRHTAVLAVEDGIIAKLFLSNAGGKTIYQFDPTTTVAYYYAHLEQYADGLQEGARVQRGQQIGTVGTSGNAPVNTPHLHFGIFLLTADKHWWQGTPLDPFEVWRK